jgi:hypothetical protein
MINCLPVKVLSTSAEEFPMGACWEPRCLLEFLQKGVAEWCPESTWSHYTTMHALQLTNFRDFRLHSGLPSNVYLKQNSIKGNHKQDAAINAELNTSIYCD